MISEEIMLATQRKTEYARTPLPKKRVVKMEGNVAYIDTGSPKSQRAFWGESTGYSENDATRRQHADARKKSAAKQKAAKQAAAAAQAKNLRKGIASTIAVIFIAFCALALLVSRYAAICTINSENNKLKGEIEAISVKTEDLKVQMELRDNLENVLDTAMHDLGMKYPVDEQRVYLDMS